VVAILIFKVSFDFDSIFEKIAILILMAIFFLTNVYEFLTTAQHYNTGSA